MQNALLLEIESLTAAERRDLANALLRAAWSATLEQARISLLELSVGADAAVLDDAGGPSR